MIWDQCYRFFSEQLLVFTRYSAVYDQDCVCVHACVCVSLCVYLQVADCVNVGSNNLDIVCLQASLEILESVVLHSTGKQSVVEQSVTSQNIIPHLERWARQFGASVSKTDSLQHASDAQAWVQYNRVQYNTTLLSLCREIYFEYTWNLSLCWSFNSKSFLEVVIGKGGGGVCAYASLLPQEWFCTLRQEVVGTSLTCHPRLFPDASLVKASAAESRSATQNLGQLRRWPHLRYPIAERSGHRHAAAASSKL